MMNKSEIEFVSRVSSAMKKCPKINTGFTAPTQTTMAIFKAYEDFSEVSIMAMLALENFTAYSSMVKFLNNEDYDTDYILGCKERATNNLEQLEKYVDNREKEHWN